MLKNQINNEFNNSERNHTQRNRVALLGLLRGNASSINTERVLLLSRVSKILLMVAIPY